MKALKSLQSKIDNLNLRERAMILGGVLLVMYFALDMFALQPVQVSQKQVQNNLLQKNAELTLLNLQLQQMATISRDSPQERDRQEILRLRQELATLDQSLNQATANLVSPQQMAKLLQMVLGQTNGLRLKKVTSLGSTSLLLSGQTNQDNKSAKAATETGPDAEETIASTAYKHGLKIEFEGDFFTTLDYMRKLEALEWNFFWDEITFKVTEYPTASGSLSLFTISLDKNWIGV
ncbi:MAG: MSHA biosis protein MshJ [Gammaproteobacteria bacterium]|nr:MSHA biosis protein MshJ [Gammaproteobacteria bacterium]